MAASRYDSSTEQFHAGLLSLHSEESDANSGDVEGKIVVDTTTIHPETTKTLAKRLKEKGAEFAAAPVFGATPVAEAGQLLVAFGGSTAVYEKISPFLKGVIAREVLLVGEEPEQATLLKTTGYFSLFILFPNYPFQDDPTELNGLLIQLKKFLMARLMELIAEAHVFAEKTGLGSTALERLLELNFGTVAYSDSVRMTTGVYVPGKNQAPWSDLDLALKDVGHGVDCAARVGVQLEVANTALEHLRRAKEYSEKNGRRRLDSSSLYGVVREDAGLDFRTDLVRKRDGEE
ncbi:hypothetical protein Daesc_002037 [Daldinia eschscholtzii]|uniref:6-phosphogluconate dehydrogenase NADP-binding domain-containing protein n=1 Tax=Daldinia eschscholtzii TaxID=292717 RepID=A0AAX6MWH6_9PEZI